MKAQERSNKSTGKLQIKYVLNHFYSNLLVYFNAMDVLSCFDVTFPAVCKWPIVLRQKGHLVHHGLHLPWLVSLLRSYCLFYAQHEIYITADGVAHTYQCLL